MTYGYECEYFLLRDGKVVCPVPRRFNRDASQNLVEVRSGYYSSPTATEESFRELRESLKLLVKREGFELASADTFGAETAGFHVHFGAYAVIDMPLIIKTLDDTFSDEIASTGRKAGQYRMKPYGFEYRSLPSSVSVSKVTKTLWELKP